jgi:hypothetical protein
MTRSIGRTGSRPTHRLLLSLLLASTLSAASLCATSPLRAAEASDGVWQARNQLVWDQDARTLVRKNFRVWDPQPELGLEFTWEQRSGTADTGDGGIVNGTGKLTWRTKGAASYDRKAVYSEYDGDMRDGRPDGFGKLLVQSGLSYEGQWRNGLMDGDGAIRYANGDGYDGHFAAGQMDGRGRYASADGSIFEGQFRDGQRHGDGTLTLASGVSYRGTWENGIEARPAGTRTDDGMQVAQAGPRITLKAYVDRPQNSKFTRDDPDFKSFVYDQDNTPGAVKLRISKAILDVWKGNATIPEDFKLFEDPSQFAPAFLVVEVVNEGAQAIQFVGGFLDVQSSATDNQPFLTYTPPLGNCGETPFTPEFELLNYGWGGPTDAKATYGFSRTPTPQGTFVSPIGAFTDTTKANLLDGLKRSGMNVDKLKAGGFKCRSVAQLPACTTQLQATGIFGSLSGNVSRKEATLFVRASGTISYNWAEVAGGTKTRSSPFTVDLPLMTFDTGQGAECGAAGPVERDLKPIKLELDRKNYRLSLGYRGALAPRQNRRFALALNADKASQHLFKAPIDLNYFIPKMPTRPDTGDADGTAESPPK